MVAAGPLSAILQTPLFWLGFLKPQSQVPPVNQQFSADNSYQNAYNNPGISQLNNIPLIPVGASGGQVGTIPPLIPREVIFGNPDYVSVRISPDGRYLSWMAPYRDALNVWVADLPNDYFNPRYNHEITGRPITKELGRGVDRYYWLYDNRTVLYLKDDGGDENWKISLVDVETGDVREMNVGAGVQSRLLASSHLLPNKIILGVNDRDPTFHDPYLVDLRTGQKQLILENNNFTDMWFDWSLRPRLGVKAASGGGDEYYVLRGGQWVFYRRVGSEDKLTTEPIGFDVSGKVLYWRDSTNRDKSALIWTDFDAMQARVLYAPSQADLGTVEQDPLTGHPVAVTINYDRQQWLPLGQSIARDLDYLKGLIPQDDMLIVDTTLDYNTWVVCYISDRSPNRYYLYDRTRQQAKFLFPEREDLGRYALARMYPVQIPSRDGLIMMSYLSLPLESDPSNRGRPNRPLPMVLCVHGGPWARDYWGYDPEVQLLANRGYAVLQVNYRASTGFGKSFVNAGDREWGGKMQTDLLDAVSWAIQQGVADPQKIAIYGGSYGGYATLAGLTFSPETFACGVDVVGPSNLVTLLENIPPYWKSEMATFLKRVGDIRTEEGRRFLESRSPLFFVDKIRRPLLIGQGANDPRVKQGEADRVVQALKTQGLPVTYILFPDEGHGFARHENDMAFVGVAEKFLAKCLGGRWEPPVEAEKNSSMQVIEPGNLNFGDRVGLG